MLNICEEENCTGCGLCENVCPKKAIHMSVNHKGFLHPIIDAAACIDCLLCQAKCPANSNRTPNGTNPVVFAAWNKNKKIRKKSSSGGVFTLLAESVIEAGGIVAGVRWKENYQAEHCLIERKEDLHLLRGSKYVQSHTGNVYRDIKSILQTGRSVLFSGTPCQVDALQIFLGKNYENLYTIDLVCHGVPSEAVFHRYLEEQSKGRIENIQNIYLRYKSPYWNYSNVRIDFKEGNPYQRPAVMDGYYNLFNFNYTLRNCCYSCPYTTLNRQGDITLADFWNYSLSEFKMRDFNFGLSCVLINNDKGNQLFDQIKNQLVYNKESIAAALKANRNLEKSCEKPSDQDDFWQDYQEGYAVQALCDKYITHPYVYPSVLWLRNLKNRYRWLFKHE
ncbi:Coenzyme F420 hydrogenase/dehydrogenase, beta subunit C-terminal domain [Scatolibacter rhodanostii]|uniref:Coenzyme F420 hydrogenase/dehydrogenase, beta subunit C-terminal domain n=1 Tax=Scatolibacter rhodanostii TaxID=2014781 RepID=UPI000C081D02|nr:Coenzyme F420 hydrogenase/dehydrogenase, beta subunit C-terminal domain [Scatolibacter rhodanostii]